MRITKPKSAIVMVPFILVANLWGQQVDDPHPASLVPSVFLSNLAQDQRHIWSSPFKARIQDLNWIVPIAGLTVGLINADNELSSRISNTNTLAKRSSTVSNAALAAVLGGSGGLYLLGRWHGDDHQRETGILSGEAAINALLIDEVFKLATRREFPTDDSGKGTFGRRNTANSSFPSGHAIVTWSIASVFAHEYPGPLTKLLAYGLATGVSVTRVTGKKHFPSDVVVGSTLGWMIGREVYARHHDPELGGAGFGTFHSSREIGEERSTESVASPYVPLDSWIYPAFDRLAALGVAPSAMEGMKPWTRRECE